MMIGGGTHELGTNKAKKAKITKIIDFAYSMWWPFSYLCMIVYRNI